MDPTHLMTQTATLTRVEDSVTEEDEYGNPVEVSSSVTVRCWLHQTNRSEDTVNADLQSETWTIYLPPNADVEGSDQITVEGADYSFDGPPWLARNPRTGIASHIEGRLRRTTPGAGIDGEGS